MPDRDGDGPDRRSPGDPGEEAELVPADAVRAAPLRPRALWIAFVVFALGVPLIGWLLRSYGAPW